MDNQFKNVKTHARLLSKAMWYEWRMKLLDGLKEGLLGVGEGMEQDAENLTQQELLLEPVLPGLVQEHGQLEDECRLLQAQADEMASCDQEELKDAREELAMIEEEIEAKQKMITDLQQQLSEKEYGIENNAHRKQDCLEEIKVAEKVRQDCRGWSAPEVAALKGTLCFPIMSTLLHLTNGNRSQSRRPRTIPWLEHRLRNWRYPNNDIPPHPPTLLHPLFLSAPCL